MNLEKILGMASRDLGGCIVKIGGNPFSNFYRNLQTTTVNVKRKGSSEATLTFAELKDEQGRWPLLDHNQVRTWAKIEIIVVFAGDKKPFFSGYIREIDTNINDSGTVATITFKCQDIFAAMERNCKRITWDADRDGLDIIREVIRPYGLMLDTNLRSMTVDNMHQNKTDYRFIRDLANQNKYEWYLRDVKRGVRKLYYGPPRTSSNTGLPKLMVLAGRETNCLNFSVNDDGYMPDQIKATTAPETGAEPVSATASSEIEVFGTESANSSDSGLGDFEWCLPPVDGNNSEAAKKRAQGEAEESAFKLKATGKLDGTKYGELLLPGNTVEVGGVGKHNGKWYVDKTTHTFESSGYVIDFTLMRNALAGNEVSSTPHKLAGVG